MNEVMELARFGVLAGVQTEAVRAHAHDLDSWLRTQPGFVARTLVGPDSEGWFTDIVRWRSQEQALAAAGRIMQEPSLAKFMALIDPARVQMSHAPVIAEVR